jgi:hypothetical protein
MSFFECHFAAADGRMHRYLAGRSPAIVFGSIHIEEAKAGTADGFRAR